MMPGLFLFARSWQAGIYQPREIPLDRWGGVFTMACLMLSPMVADVAELADAQASGACGGNPVEVRVLSSAVTVKIFP